ncbi:hypothetical protein F4810DRAFT_672716 [Camillea tinctor]|nr:hypothetical protein F4810DRAFT_672716 [Camillea tinctor]
MMERKRARTSRIEIPIPVKPRPYRRGDGPALAPLSLTLENDSDAFIIDRRVRPGVPVNGEMKLEMYYVVGWPDLPAARVCVLATRIFDYVSPRTLEDWEYEYSLEKDKQREQEEAAAVAKAKRRAEKAAKARLLEVPSANTPGAGIPNVPEKKKRGRPSKAERSARELAQQTSFEDISNADVPLPPASTSGPSLSTPKKKRLAAAFVAGAEDRDEEDVSTTIYKQLYGGDTEMIIDDPNEEEKDKIGPENSRQAFNHASTLSTAKYAPSLMSNTSPSQANPRDEWNSDRLPRKTSATPVPVPAYPRPGKSPKKQISSTPGPELITPIPGHTMPSTLPKKPTKETPISPPPHPPVLDRNGVKPTPHAQSTLLHYGFTPAGRSSAKWPAATETPVSGDPTTHSSHTSYDDNHNPSGSSPARSQKKKKKPKPKHDPAPPNPGEAANDAEEEPVYVVKRLEGDQVTEVDGRAERFFKVRWEGDWPPDQNPTWEPEANLPAALVRTYLKHKNAKTKGRAKTEFPRKRHMLKRKYSSVAEAFEGAEDEDELALGANGDTNPRNGWAGRHGAGGRDRGDEDDGEERLLVTEQRSRPGTPAGKKQFDLALAREIESSFRRGIGSSSGDIRSSSLGL